MIGRVVASVGVCLVVFIGVWVSDRTTPDFETTNVRHLLEEAGSPHEYRLFEAADISSVMRAWTTKYPDFARVTTAQERYGFPRAGDYDDCPFDGEEAGCLNYILTIQDYKVHPVDSESSKRLPTVVWSGELHGDERVGPTATIEAASLLLRAATCEAKPDILLRDTSQWNSELQDARNCRSLLDEHGVTRPYRQWLARLVATRRIIVVPTANALGFYRGVRTEAGVDPNRDFPFDKEDFSLCMQSIAARTLNEIFREEIVQFSLTFHGGAEMIAYEWGATSFVGYMSPDDEAQRQLASVYSAYGGEWYQSQAYIYGPANDVIYPVRGGFEDWAYAGSFAPVEFVQPCEPSTYDGYPIEQTMYEDSSLRAFNMLVETSNAKLPTIDALGMSMDVVRKDASEEYNGHVARNIRVALLATDLVEPYLSIIGVNDLSLSDDLVPIQARGTREACQKARQVTVPVGTQEILVQWTVGGAITIDETSLHYGRWQDVPDDTLNCMSQPSEGLSLFRADRQNTISGVGFYSSDGAIPQLHGEEVLGPVFEARVDLSQYLPEDEVVVMARARVDSSWLDQIDFQDKPIFPFGSPPQSHMVNARNDPNWRMANMEGKVVQGRLDWYTTIPLTVNFGEPVSGTVQDEADRFASSQCLPRRSLCSKGPQCCSGMCLPMLDEFRCASSKFEITLSENRTKGGGGAGGQGGGRK